MTEDQNEISIQEIRPIIPEEEGGEEELTSNDKNNLKRNKTKSMKERHSSKALQIDDENAKDDRYTYDQNQKRVQFTGSINKEDELFDNEEEEVENEELRDSVIITDKINDVSEIIKLEDPFYRCDTIYSRTSAFRNKNSIVPRKTLPIKDKPFLTIQGTRKTEIGFPEISEGLIKEEIDESLYSTDSLIIEGPDFQMELTVNKFDSIAMVICQLVNCMIKYPLTNMALCIKTLGLIGGPVAMIIIVLTGLYSLNLLMAVKQKTKENSYLIFTEKMFGESGKLVMLILSFLACYGGCISFILLFLKVSPNFFNFPNLYFFLPKNSFLCIILAIILIFLCYTKDVSGIKKMAYWGFLGVIFFVIFTVIDFLQKCMNGDIIEDNKETLFPKLNNWKEITSAANSLACLILCFGYHVFAFSIQESMGEERLKPFMITTGVGVFIVTMIYLICGILGYLIYDEKITDTIVEAVGNDDFLNTLLCLSIMVNVIMSFPINFAVVKSYFSFILEVFITYLYDCFKWMFCNAKYKEERKRRETLNRKPGQFFKNRKLIKIPWYIEVICTILLFCSIFYCALTFPNLKTVASLLGSTTGMLFSFIYPASFYVYFGKAKCLSCRNIIPLLIIFFGFTGMIICLGSTIISAL